MDAPYLPLSRCLCCDSATPTPILDLGAQPLANSYHAKGETLPAFPLGVNLCENCFHVQQFVAVDPDLMFKNYLYVSGTSDTLRKYFDTFAQIVEERTGRTKGRVLDIACNDGTQLASFIKRGWQGFGVDPAENLLERSRATGASVLCEYWNDASAQKLGGTFDAIIAQNVFAHVADPLSFLVACKGVMDKTSKLFIQTSQANMFEEGQFDTIYHEHISFFSARSMQTLAQRAGLVLEDVFITPVHGGSYVFMLSLSGSTANADARIALEEKNGRYSVALYRKFAETAKAAAFGLKNVVEKYRAKKIRVVGYGAAAKGNTLLNFGRITLDYIVDDNPLKQGLCTPGMDIEIAAPARLAQEKGNIVVVPLAWNFFDEIHRKVKAFRPGNNDTFITYFPTVEERA